MSPREFTSMLRARWLTLGACAVIGIGIGCLVNLATPTRWAARAQVFVSINYYGGTQPPGINSTSEFALAQIQSYVRLATATPVIAKASRLLGSAIPKGEISASNPPTTVLVDVTSTSSDPKRAAAQANAVAASLIPYLSKVETRLPNGDSAVKASIVEPATAPASPSQPRTLRNMGLGLLLGLAAGLGIALVRARFDDSATD